MTSAVYAPTKKGQKPDPCSILSFYVLNFTKSLSANENINSDSRSFCVADYQASMFTSYLRPLSTSCSQVFIAKFDVLLNRFGIDAVLFGPKLDARSGRNDWRLGKRDNREIQGCAPYVRQRILARVVWSKTA